MKKIRMLRNLYPVRIVNKKGEVIKHTFSYCKGKEYILNENSAKPLLKKKVLVCEQPRDWPCWVEPVAELVEDYGLHFGQSKHTYKKAHKSELRCRN